MSGNKVPLSKDKLFHFKKGDTSPVQCLHLYKGSMVSEKQDQEECSYAPDWSQPEGQQCSVEQHWHDCPTENVKRGMGQI